MQPGGTVSGIAGVFHLDGRPAAAAEVTSMTSSMAHRGLDGIGAWVSGPVALGHCLLRTTSRSHGESQPVRLEVTGLALTMDGRVDNRADLLAALGPDRAWAGGSDAGLVLRCYDRWGKACVARIIGDFAFALWDGTRQS